ncbi:MAG: RNA polymerase sigma factor [Ktedonobacteraceae bacterium]
MQRLNAGETQNGGTLYDRFAPTLFPYLYAQTASMQDAEDLLLEVFIAAFHNDKLARMPDEQQLAWLRRVARNKVIDRYRHTSLLTILPLEQVMEQEDNALTPEQRAEQQERYERLYEALKQLSPLQQEMIQLRYVHALRFVEIAAYLDKPEGSVRKLMTRTLRQLRELYEQRERNEQQ